MDKYAVSSAVRRSDTASKAIDVGKPSAWKTCDTISCLELVGGFKA